MLKQLQQKPDGMTRAKAQEHAAWLRKLLMLENETGMIGIETVEWLLIECLLHGAKHGREANNGRP